MDLVPSAFHRPPPILAGGASPFLVVNGVFSGKHPPMGIAPEKPAVPALFHAA
jgi:hypothetical protein